MTAVAEHKSKSWDISFMQNLPHFVQMIMADSEQRVAGAIHLGKFPLGKVPNTQEQDSKWPQTFIDRRSESSSP